MKDSNFRAIGREKRGDSAVSGGGSQENPWFCAGWTEIVVSKIAETQVCQAGIASAEP
jgi:hypothetical protein